jgi:hypothetical protein
MIHEYIKLDRTVKDYALHRAKLEDAFKLAYPENIFSEVISDDGLSSWCKTVPGHGVSVPADSKVSLDTQVLEHSIKRQKIVTDVKSWESKASLVKT